MIRFNVPTLTLREPLRARPVYGLLLGAATGGLFALLSGGKAFESSWSDQTVGYLLAGATAGAIIGLFLPQFRRRWIAGVVVGVATATGLAIAAPYWRAEVFRDLSPFFGVVYGIIYSVLFWRVEKAVPSGSPASDDM